jgi:hypothetical protein
MRTPKFEVKFFVKNRPPGANNEVFRISDLIIRHSAMARNKTNGQITSYKLQVIGNLKNRKLITVPGFYKHSISSHGVRILCFI